MSDLHMEANVHLVQAAERLRELARMADNRGGHLGLFYEAVVQNIIAQIDCVDSLDNVERLETAA